MNCVKAMASPMINTPLQPYQDQDYEELHKRLCKAIDEKDLVELERVLVLLDSIQDTSVFTSVFTIKGDGGCTVLHRAVKTGDERVLAKLWKALGKKPDLQQKLKWTVNDEGNTPIHLAVRENLPNMLDIFFSAHNGSGAVSPLSSTSSGGSGVPRHHRPSLASQFSSPWIIPHDHAPSLLELALSVDPAMAGIVLDHLVGNPVTYCPTITDHVTLQLPPTPLETTVPLVVVGDSGAGKSSIIRALQIEGKLSWLKYFILSVPGADTHKAGIIPTQFESSWFGRVVFFDLSSHREFVHEAILNCGSLIDAVFLIVVNLADSIQKMIQQILYWLEFVRYHYSKVAGQTPPNVIIIASHLYDHRLGPLANRERFRVHVLPRSMDNINTTLFNIHGKIEMDCRKVSAEHAFLRHEIRTQCDHIRESRAPLLAKTYILHAIINDMAKRPSNTIQAFTVGELKQEIQSSAFVCQLFQRLDEEIIGLCRELNELNLLLFLIDPDCLDQSWLVPDSYPFLCQIEQVIFPPLPEELNQSNGDGGNGGNGLEVSSGSQNNYATVETNGILNSESIKRKILKLFPEVNSELLLKLMIHYKYCERKSLRNEVDGYFFPHLLKPHLDIPQWDPEDNRFMFAWTIAPEAQYHYFMPHLVHHFFLELSQAEELGIQQLERATRTLAWGDPSGVEVVVHIQSSQRLFLSMRSTPHHQLQCLKLRKPLLKKIMEILESLSPSNPHINVVESFIPPQKKVILPYSSEERELTSKVRLYQTESIKQAVINMEDSVQPFNHAIPFVTVNDLLHFEPYYHICPQLRERIHQADEVVMSEEDYHDMCMAFGSAKLQLLDELLDNVEQESERNVPLQDLIRQSWVQLMARHGGVTYRQLMESLDMISLFTLEEIMMQQQTTTNQKK